MAKNKFNPQWLQDHLNDPYVKLARKEGYRARAVYKLKEIDETEKLITPTSIVVDLGAAPGSWSQYTARILRQSKSGRIIALDLLPMEAIEGVAFILGDFRETEVLQELERLVGNAQVDVVLSDMAPNLSGIASADAARMQDIVQLALDFALRYLTPEGALLVKCFHGSGYSQIVQTFKQHFVRVRALKPKASRDKSSETFLLGKGLKIRV